ncbi:MAG: NAD(P)-dependent oxidoreductase [Rhodobiaceae bacterium]|nr:NAD(P)-dependent oxidoreductase [Rhodobiaceae bacterium]
MNGSAKPDRLAFIGFGEAAMAFLDGWGSERPERISAFDIKTDVPETRADMEARYQARTVRGATDVGAALDGAGVAFSVVTADQALEAARAAAPALAAGTLWLDCNSCAPDTKRRAADFIEGAGGRYVDVAVMAPVHPKRHRVPLLVSGPHARDAHETLKALDMCPEIAGDAIGQASAIKMLRSVMVKGLEALTAECFLAARRAGVEEQVLASLEASDPDIAWRKRTAYNLERMIVHGARRAAEMREVAVTVAALGLPNGMSAACAHWQDEIARHGIDPGENDFTARVDRVLSVL